MATDTDTIQTSEPVSEFGPSGPPSYVDTYLPIITLDVGMKDLIGADQLAWLGANVPMIDYHPELYNGNFLSFDSPNLNVPGYGSFDLKAIAGFDIDLGVYLHYQYDFGKLAASATVTAPRVDGEKAYGSYLLTTSNVTVTATVDALTGTEPFLLEIKVAGSQLDANGVPLPGTLAGGIFGAGVYRDGSVYKGIVQDFGFGAVDPLTGEVRADVDTAYNIAGPVYPGQNIAAFDNSYLSGFLNVPQLPNVSATAGGTGAAALDGEAENGGDGPVFGNLTFRPINMIPVVGQINSGSFLLQSPIVDAGLDYTILGLDVRLEALFHQTLKVDIKSVSVHAEAWENITEDRPVDPDRHALDAADGNADNYVKVSEANGVLGDTLVLANFSQGDRDLTRVDEYYSITLRVNNSIDLLLRGGVDFSFLSLSAFINPILIDEMRFALGPLFSTSFQLDLASLKVYDGAFDITFTTRAAISHTINTIVEVSGTPGNDNDTLVSGQVQYDGAAGNDSITGNGLGNVIAGGPGNDSIFGQGGNDTLLGGDGVDSLDGGFQDDTIFVGGASGGLETAIGGAGNDSIVVGDASGSFRGGIGDDTIVGTLTLAQTFQGGDGNDLLVLDASAQTAPFTLDFSLGGGSLFSGLFTTLYSGFERISFLSGSGNDRLIGTAAADTLSGGGGDDSIEGGDLYDLLEGGDGNDTLLGQGSLDTLRGGAGDDRLDGGDGLDWLYGDAGNDTLDGGAFSDVIYGGDGDDSISDAQGGNQIHGGRGADRIIAAGDGSRISGDDGNDAITASSGALTVSGGAGADRINVASAASGVVSGDFGSDTIAIWATGLAVTVHGDDPDSPGETPSPLFGPSVDVLRIRNFSTATSFVTEPYAAPVGLAGPVVRLAASGTLANGTTWDGIEAFHIIGNAGAQYLVAGDAADTLEGNGGDDYLDGGAGRDELAGGIGNDTLVGGFGDSFAGGDGIDLMVFDASGIPGGARGAVVGFDLNLGTPGRRTSLDSADPASLAGRSETPARVGSASGGTQIADIEQLMMTGSGAGDDTITGAERADTILGGGGDDRLDGLDGDDEIDGGTGSDTIHGGAGNDLIGATGNDTTRGARSGDVVYGDGGDDTIMVNRHAVWVAGGSGNDTILVLDTGVFPLVDGMARINGDEGADSILGSDAGEYLIGGIDPIDRPPEDFNPAGMSRLALAAFDGADTIDGFGGDDSIEGGAGNDSLAGGADNDSVDGGSGDDSIDGGTGADSLSGGSGADTITGGAGNDTVRGGNGRDALYGNDGGDALDGGEGNDTLSGGAGADTMGGGNGDDSMAGGLDSDWLLGGGGNDRLRGEAGDDLLEGEAGDDSLGGGAGYDNLYGGAGNDKLDGGADGDFIDGGEGNDLVVDMAGDGPGTLWGDQLLGGAGNDSIFADNHADTVDGGDGDDWIVIADGGVRAPGGLVPEIAGGLGNDTIEGSGAGEKILGGAAGGGIVSAERIGPVEGGGVPDGDDMISAGGGDDTVSGGTGNDTIDAGDGYDRVNGGDGDDRIDGGDGADDLAGDAGNDTILGGANGEDVGDMIFGGAGNDSLTGSTGLDLIRGGDDNDTIEGGLAVSLGGGRDSLYGDGGEDRISASGDALLDGGEGNDTLVLGAGVQEVLMDYSLAQSPGTDRVENFAPDEDRIHFYGAGLDASNMIVTYTGEGLLISFGRAGAARVLLVGLTPGDLGANDIVFSGPPIAREDAIFVSASTPAQIGAAVLLGNDLGLGLGIDAVYEQSLAGAALSGGGVSLPAITAPGTFGYLLGNADGQSYGSATVDVLFTTGGDDSIAVPPTLGAVSTSGSYIDGKDGNDALTGNAGRDWLIGGPGNDTLLGDANDDTLQGGDGRDALLGGAGADSLEGGLGNDKLDGGAGSDVLRGGGDADRFIFRNVEPAAVDAILDFSHAEGDVIDLAQIDANARAAGNQAFVLVTAFTGHAGELVIASGASPALSTVSGDVDGDGLADFTITVQSDAALVAGDFML